MNEIKELWKPAKRKGAIRMIISGITRNMYFIDLIAFSSKQHKWVNKLTNKQTNYGPAGDPERAVDRMLRPYLPALDFFPVADLLGLLAIPLLQIPKRVSRS